MSKFQDNPADPILINAISDDEICPRCGAHMQFTHHPLCQEWDGWDGFPTGLADEKVRAAIELLADGEVRVAIARYLLKDLKLVYDKKSGATGLISPAGECICMVEVAGTDYGA